MAILVRINEVFFHCAKCIVHCKHWEPASWSELVGLPTLAPAMFDHGRLDKTVEQMQAFIEGDANGRLYLMTPNPAVKRNPINRPEYLACIF